MGLPIWLMGIYTMHAQFKVIFIFSVSLCCSQLLEVGVRRGNDDASKFVYGKIGNGLNPSKNISREVFFFFLTVVIMTGRC